MHKWPKVRLGEVMSLSDTAVPSAQLGEVNLAGVYSFGRGLFRRGPMSPAETSYKTYNRLVADDFVISQPKAWEGALARVTPEFDGWFLSPVFPTFRADRTRLEPAFLEWYCKRSSVWTELQRNSRGIGARRETVSHGTFLALEIPLPPLFEQRRIVARIEQLAAKIEEARGLRRQAVKEVTALVLAGRRATIGEQVGDDWMPLSKHIAEIENGKSPATDGREALAGEWGVLKVGAVSYGYYNDRENKALPLTFRAPSNLEVKSGDFLMCRANTRELVGSSALVLQTREKLMLSDKTFRFIFQEPKSLLPEYLDHVLKAPVLREQIEKKASGTSPTMKNISKGKVLELLVPNHSLTEQRRIVDYLDNLTAKVDSLKRLQLDNTAELDALLPSVLDKEFKEEL